MEVNIWKKFVGLMPGGSRTIGKVVFINTVQGTSTIEMRDGARFNVKGTSVPVDSRAIITDGVIVGQAPDLPHYVVEV